MVEGILMKQVRLVDEKDGAYAFLGEILDMRVDGEKQIPGGVGLGQTESQAKMTVEVAPSDSAVLAVDQAEVGRGERVAQGAQHAGLSDPWLAGEQGAGTGVHGVGEVFDQGEFSFLRPRVLSRRTPEGSNGVRASCGTSRQTGERARRALWRGSTGRRMWRAPSCSIHGGSLESTTQRETVTSFRARKPRSVSQSSPSMGMVQSPRTRRRTCTVRASRSFFSSNPSGWRGAAAKTVSGVLPIRPAWGER